MARHEILGGKVHVYKRDQTRQWHCSASINGRQLRTTTKQESLEQAKDFAEDWYLELRGKLKRGELKSGKTFAEAATRFLHEYEVITLGQRSPRMVEQYECKLRVHLLPYFGKKWLSEITPALVQDYRIHRHGDGKGRRGTIPTRSTMHKDIVTLRQVLKSAMRNGWLDHMPDLSEPYRTSGKISHRAWFSPEEYKQLYEATRRRVEKPPKKRWKSSCEQAHDYVLFMANTGLRPDEASRLEFRDVSIVTDDASKQTILEIKVRGKRGTGYCKSTTGAVLPFNRLRERNMKQPTDRLFPKPIRMVFNAVLDEEELRFDREGNRRTPYSLRHTYICLRLMEGADIYQIAKNCRTSVEMIEKYYASHIASSLDAAAINVRRPRKRKKGEAQDDENEE
jgi:integrase